MRSASPYVTVNNVKESVDYYQSIFGGEIKILNENAGRVNHAELQIGSSLIHFSAPFSKGPSNEIEIIMQCESEEEIRRVFDALITDGGKETVKLQDTFFGALHGQATDKINGINWVLNYFKA